ncbi:MAG: 16S rRNA processing protein RimM [Chloroflexi bacterium]|nr:16S rRNA processing protein RimM [Chloroflexota bacterium]
MVLVGRITSAVGLDGSLRVDAFSDVPHRFAPGSILYLHGTPRKVQRSRSGRGLILKLEGVDTRNAAEALRGAELCVPAEDVPPSPQDTYYHFQLLGMEVVDVQGAPLGVITEILTTPANDVYIVTMNGRETLVPAIADVVREVDVAARHMVVDLPKMA